MNLSENEKGVAEAVMSVEKNLRELTISDADFNRMVKFIQTNYGIDLHAKRQLIQSRLGNVIKRKGYTDFRDYVDYLLNHGTGDDINELLSKLTTNYTYFQRETESFDFLVQHILPDLEKKHAADKVLSIWSAACSSGEEPYNVTMYMMDYFGPKWKDWDARMLATDLSVDVLRKAQAGVYQLPDNMPEAWKKNYFRPSGTRYEIAQKVKDNVIFRQFNLMDEIKFKRKFDLIFCRNVMIYFDMPTKTALINRLYDATVPGGYLIISLSENLPPDTRWKRLTSAIFQK